MLHMINKSMAEVILNNLSHAPEAIYTLQAAD